MDQLDNNKIPRVGTPGEKYRDIQLIVQLPKQDLAEEYCKQLQNPSQKKSFEDFRTMRDSIAMDIARINHITEDMVSLSNAGHVVCERRSIDLLFCLRYSRLNLTKRCCSFRPTL